MGGMIFILPGWVIFSVAAALITSGGIAGVRDTRRKHAKELSKAVERILGENGNDYNQTIAATLEKLKHKQGALAAGERRRADKVTMETLRQEVKLLEDALKVLRTFRDAHEDAGAPESD